MYILHQIEFESTAYNILEIIPLEEEPDIEKFTGTFKKLIHRHESLRTSFHMINQEPVQRIHHQVEFEIEYDYFPGVEAEVKEGGQTTKNRPGIYLSSVIRHLSFEFIRPFDLSRAPLLRVGLLKDHHRNFLLLVDMHHIISDGVSHQVLQQDFIALDRDQQLPPLRIQYKDFSQWQNNNNQKESLKQQEDYWLKAYAGEIPVLNLPTDYPRPSVQSFEGSSITIDIGEENTRALKRLSLKEGMTLYMVLPAAANVLLSKLSSREDIVIGSPVVGRRHADLEKIIGMFVNTLPTRHYPREEKTVNQFLTEVKQGTLKDLENQEYQFEDLVDKLELERDISRNPLFDVMFALQNAEPEASAAPEEHVEEKEPYWQEDASPYRDIQSKFDMTITAVDSDQHLFFNFNYNTALFKKETIQRYTGYFKRIISGILKDRKKKILAVEIMSREEKKSNLI